MWTVPLVLALASSVQDSQPAKDAAPAEWPKVERWLVGTPEFRREPRFFVVTFGPEAKTQVWCAFDGDTLYVDLDRDRDLRDPGERVVPGSELTIEDADGATRHSKLKIDAPVEPHGDQPGYIHVSVMARGKFGQYQHIRIDERLARPRTAPACVFDGSLRMRFNRDVATLKLVPGQVVDLGAMIETIRPDRAGWALVDNSRGVPSNKHPELELAFPSKVAGGAPIVVRTPLKQRC